MLNGLYYTFQLKKLSFQFCILITNAGITAIIEHCKGLCYLEFEDMLGLPDSDMDAIYEQLLQSGRKVDRRAEAGKIIFILTSSNHN
jgi:hypothetical protein